ncbi:hypothetical protein C2S52_023666 [Perilla frutescens var. hirtella]|nr:hypothetical protein C2S52_023666 [Perilla frutescens var. hirtella]
MIEFLETRPEAPVAVILQFCRPNVYRGDVRVSSLFNITKIVLDQKVSEIADFNFRYLTTGKVRSASITTLTSSSSRTIHVEIRDGDFEMKTISQIMTDGKGRSTEGIPLGLEKLANKKALFNIGSSSFKSVVQSKSRVVIKKTIKKIMEDGESGEFMVFATINDIEDIIGMSYVACKICRKELDPYIELKLFCEKCQSFDICGITRYKLNVEVSDSTAITTFRMSDTQCMELLGQKLPEDEALEVLPADIERIANKKALFTIIVLPGQVNNYKGPYGVVKVASEDIVQSEGTSSKSNKGKEKVHESADENNSISDALLTPRKKNIITSNAVVLMDDDDEKRKLIDEFSATTQKRTKRLQKKENQ